MNWISVNERRPEFNQPVIVHQPEWRGEPVTIAVLVCIDADGYKFCFDFNQCELDRNDYRWSVTDWMPLPEPPTESGE